MKEIAFMSERTAEYALVPNLSAQLSGRFPLIMPIYYWGTREGSRVGRESCEGLAFRIVAIFARRPKVEHPGGDSILVKVNDVLFSAAHAGAEIGVAVLAGVPLVSSLADLSVENRCAWFQLTSSSEQNVDREVRLMITGEVAAPMLPEGITGPLSQLELIETVDSNCQELEWESALEAMRHVKSAGETHHGFFGGSYKPFFMLLTE